MYLKTLDNCVVESYIMLKCVLLKASTQNTLLLNKKIVRTHRKKSRHAHETDPSSCE